MINPVARDVGRAVIYQAAHEGAPREHGVVTSVTDSLVFVRYSDQRPGSPGKATRLEDLDRFEFLKPRKVPKVNL